MSLVAACVAMIAPRIADLMRSFPDATVAAFEGGTWASIPPTLLEGRA